MYEIAHYVHNITRCKYISMLQIYRFVVTTYFLPSPLQKETTLISPTPRTIFDFVETSLPFPYACTVALAFLVSIRICMCDHNVWCVCMCRSRYVVRYGVMCTLAAGRLYDTLTVLPHRAASDLVLCMCYRYRYVRVRITIRYVERSGTRSVYSNAYSTSLQSEYGVIVIIYM